MNQPFPGQPREDRERRDPPEIKKKEYKKKSDKPEMTQQLGFLLVEAPLHQGGLSVPRGPGYIYMGNSTPVRVN